MVDIFVSSKESAYLKKTKKGEKKMDTFMEMSTEELLAVEGGDWGQFAKALSGTLFIALGVVVCAVPGGAGAGVALAATGIYGLGTI